MPDFSDQLDSLDTAVQDVLCDDASYYPQGGGVVPGIRVQIEFPAETERLQGASIVRAKPTVSVAVAQIAVLLVSETFVVKGERWKVMGAPTRPGDGRWWVAEVQRVAL